MRRHREWRGTPTSIYLTPEDRGALEVGKQLFPGVSNSQLIGDALLAYVVAVGISHKYTKEQVQAAIKNEARKFVAAKQTQTMPRALDIAMTIDEPEPQRAAPSPEQHKLSKVAAQWEYIDKELEGFRIIDPNLTADQAIEQGYFNRPDGPRP